MLITRNLPPVIGGMERLLGHVCEALSKRFETVLIAPRGSRIETLMLDTRTCVLSPPARFLLCAAVKSAAAARRYRPRIVIAGSGLTAPIAFVAARLAGARYSVYLHGLDIAARARAYRALFLPAIRRADLVLANSRYTAGRAVDAGVPDGRIVLLHPGVSLPPKVPEPTEAARRFRERFDVPAGPLLLGVGRLTQRKGFSAFVRESLPIILQDLPDAQFVIAGEVPAHAALHSRDEAAAIRAAAHDAGAADHVHLIGPLDDTGLSLAWPAADVHVFPVWSDPDDPEGFGMVALEAAAWGVPTVAFASGGITDAVGPGQSGYLVEPGAYHEFAAAVIHAVSERTTLSSGARAFAADFAWTHFEDRLTQALGRLLETV